MKPNTDSFTLIAEGARNNWLAARAANDIGSCIPHNKIPIEERVALVTDLIANLPPEELELVKLQLIFKLQEIDDELRREHVTHVMDKFDRLITDLTGEKHD
jgi:phospholipid N-methyltransferase